MTMLLLLTSIALAAPPAETTTSTAKPRTESPKALTFLGLVQSRGTISNVESGSPFFDGQVIGELGGLNGTKVSGEETTEGTEFRTTGFLTLAPTALGGQAELTAGFEIDYAFGDASYGLGGNSGGGIGADQVNLQTRRLYAAWRPRLGPKHHLAFVLGQQFVADGAYDPSRAHPDDLFRTGGGLRLFGTEAAGLTVYGRYADDWGERARYRVGAYSLYEQGMSARDDVTLFLSDVQIIPEYGFRLGGHVWHLRDRSGGGAGSALGAGPSSGLSEMLGGPRLDLRLDELAPAPEIDADFFWFAVDGGYNHRLDVAPYGVNGLAVLQAGGIYATDLPDDTSIGWLADIEGRYRIAAGDGSVLRAEVLYTSDDDPELSGYGGLLTGNSYGVAAANWGTHGSVLLFPDIQAINRQVSVIHDVSNGGDGLLAFSGNAGYDFVPNRFGATVGFAAANNGAGQLVGTEYNARLRYRPLPLFDLGATVATVTGTDNVVNPWTAYLSLQWAVFE